MGGSRYQAGGNGGGMGKGVLPMALIGVAGYALWKNRDQLGQVFQQMKDKASQMKDEAGQQGGMAGDSMGHAEMGGAAAGSAI
jgi:hypothetical protein